MLPTSLSNLTTHNRVTIGNMCAFKFTQEMPDIHPTGLVVISDFYASEFDKVVSKMLTLDTKFILRFHHSRPGAFRLYAPVEYRDYCKDNGGIWYHWY